LEPVERYYSQLLDHEHDFQVDGLAGIQFEPHDFADAIGGVCTASVSCDWVWIAIPDYQRVILNADKHTDDVVDFDALRVHTAESFLTNFTKVALDWIEAVTDKVVCVNVCVGGVSWVRMFGWASCVGVWERLLLQSSLVVTVDVTAEWFLIFGG
jgi:hypothetical protein